MGSIIEIQNLSKQYNSIRAVNSISVCVDKGEMFGLVGPDGAGKTSTIRIMCGLLPFEEGSVFIIGKDIKSERNQVQKNIGYLSQRFSLYGDLTVDENIEFFADIHNVLYYKSRRDELLEFTRLSPFRTRLADKLSGGMKQKLALACSLIHEPQILFLDEPTTGVDLVSRRDFWKILSKLMKSGVTIFMTTPYLDEAERCTRVALMNNGEILALDRPQNLKASLDKKVIELVCKPIRKAYNLLKTFTSMEIQLFGDRINLFLDDLQNDVAKVERLFSENEIKISSKREISPSLENIFIYLIKKIM